MVRIFLTGATGYVGGQALRGLTTAFPQSQIACLIRDAAKADHVSAIFPQIRVVLGDLDDKDLIVEESSIADIVLNLASTGHVNSAQAIAKGITLSERTKKPGHWIQMSGATLFVGAEVRAGKYGEAPGATLDDLDDSKTLLSMIRESSARVVDNLVLAQKSDQVRTALIVGPLIYGPGEGPVNKRSIQAPELARVTLERGHGVVPGAGLSQWCNVHITDLGNLFVKLVQAAVDGKTGLWNEDGVYIPENGIMSFGQLANLICQKASHDGLIKGDPDQTEVLDKAEADKVTSHGAILWGTNAAFTSGRAKTVLGWRPVGLGLADTIPDLLKEESRRRSSSRP